MNGKKAVIYARQSFTKEESSASIQQQIENCRQWCEKNNIEILDGPNEIPGSERWIYFMDSDLNVLEYIMWLDKEKHRGN